MNPNFGLSHLSFLRTCLTVASCSNARRAALFATYATRAHIDDNYNEANIRMISKRLQKQIFGKESNYNGAQLPEHLRDKFRVHNIDIDGKNEQPLADDFQLTLPPLEGSNIDEHFRAIAVEQSKDYVKLADRLLHWKAPAPPELWCFQAGWTRYDRDGASRRVDCPLEDVIVFDVEVSVPNGPQPCLAVALTPEAWYSWTSSALVRAGHGERTDPVPEPVITSPSMRTEDLIPMFNSSDEALTHPKCLVGHFVSFDRARIREEYSLQETKARFLDTMALHVAVCGLTSNQRMLKVKVDKQQFRNKVWRDFVELRGRFGRVLPEELEEDFPDFTSDNSWPSMAWLSESSMDNLLDVYRLHCGKEPCQNKDSREIFIKSGLPVIAEDFQNLVSYCANDTWMTHEIFKCLWPEFKRRMTHPVSLAGVLEMSTVFLPINENWTRYQQKSELTYQKFKQEQKETLIRLAKKSLELSENDKYRDDPWMWDLDWSTTRKTKTSANYFHLPKWYRELIPKPLSVHVDNGPTEVSMQTRVTPKLLRLSWDGIPLHFDHSLRWGVLLPGRDPAVDKDPTFYEESGRLAPHFEVVRVGRGREPKRESMIFPYATLLAHWSRHIGHRLQDLQELVSQPSPFSAELLLRDAHLLDELRRTCDNLPLEAEELRQVRQTIDILNGLLAVNEEELQKLREKDRGLTGTSMNMLLCELVIRGREFWSDEKRYAKRHRAVTETVNPVIATCWFSHLPHKEGLGKAVGNPLSKPFLRYIAEGRLRSEYGDEADRLLRSQIHCSYWQGAATRIREQICVWLEDGSVSSENSVLETSKVGIILPQIKVMGTVTRRAVEKTWLTASNAYPDRLGSELKSMIQAPPGFRFVGADVDSQELWIAALLGDASTGIQGGTPFGWMVLQGSKKDGTDLHSVTSRIIGISRDSAKVLNYARLYGAGKSYSAQLLQQFNSGLSAAEANQRARTLMEQTKGRRKGSQQRWQGGSESETFNRIEEIARQKRPRTPVLGAELTQALNPAVVGDDFLTSRINWVVQSSAVDYLHCLLVCMRWLKQKFDIPARFSISIHDEVRYLVAEGHTDRAALALQISNLLTRALFAHNLNLHDLPLSVAFFSSVDVDRCLRKEPGDDCITPSNADGLHKSYRLPAGDSLDMAEILRRTDGKLDADIPSRQ